MAPGVHPGVTAGAAPGAIPGAILGETRCDKPQVDVSLLVRITKKIDLGFANLGSKTKGFLRNPWF